MVIFDSLRTFFNVLMSPFEGIFYYFPDLKLIIGGLLFLSLSYFGWRAIK